MKHFSFKKHHSKKILFSFLLLPMMLLSQVGINTTSPSAGAILDITSTDKGLLVPRVDISDLSTIAPITGGAPAGLLVYNTNTTTGPGFVFWDGGDWTTVDGAQDWQKNGNAATTPGTDYIGTSDAVDFAIGTTATERARVLANGQFLINGTTAADPADRFTVYGAAAESAMNAYSTGGGIGVYGEETGGGLGVFGNTSGAGFGLTGQNNGTGLGVFGLHTGNGVGLQGQSNGSGLGVFGYSAGFIGVEGDSGGAGIGVWGYTNNAGAIGIIAQNETSTGLLATSSTAGLTYITNTGATLSGVSLGGVGLTTDAAGNGLVGLGHGSSNLGAIPSTGSGIAGIGLTSGVYGYAGTGDLAVANQGNAAGIFQLDTDNDVSTAGANDIRAQAILAGFDNGDPDGGGSEVADDLYFGGYFSGGNESFSPTYAYVGVRHGPSATGGTDVGTTDYKIIGTGSVSTLINDKNNTPRVLFAPEAPEILFQDYGTGQLINGQVRIDIDPLLRSAIFVDAQHPLKVFVTLEGDCNGVFVTNKSADGFTVKELQGGTSNVPFSWQIVANRADTKDANGKIISKHVDVRLPKGPKAHKVRDANKVNKKHETQTAPERKKTNLGPKKLNDLPAKVQKLQTND